MTVSPHSVPEVILVNPKSTDKNIETIVNDLSISPKGSYDIR